MTTAGGSVLGRLKRRSRWFALLACLALVPMVTSCYGRFPLTKAVYRYNGEVTDNELGQTLLMYLFVFLPVYAGASLGDVFIFNTVEYWTGERIEVGSATMPDGTELSMTPSADGQD